MTTGAVLVTGGTGYIGSFTALALLEAGHEVIIVDNLCNSSEEVITRIEMICGKRPQYVKCDITNQAGLDTIFGTYPSIENVIHFAALKAVGESGEIPLDYYHVNLYGTLCLLRSMKKHHVTNIVFSSSATVYGDATRFPNMIPIPETCPLGPTNPYGNTKVAVETMIADFINAERANAIKAGADYEVFNAALLRYFNPVGGHPSGIMGEDPQGIAYNLLPILAQVATKRREKLAVYGTDYNSKDGTAIRDFIHILDLAAGHLMALDYLRKHHPGVRAWNLGTGNGSTVLDVVAAFSRTVGRELPYEVLGRRAGDVLNLTANSSRANTELGWKAKRTLADACEDLWKWIHNNPHGYRQPPPESLLNALRVQSP